MIKTTAFIPVFEEKLARLKRDLKSELGKAKSDRRKYVMKSLIKEAKGIQKLVKQCTPEDECVCCPNCGFELEKKSKKN